MLVHQYIKLVLNAILNSVATTKSPTKMSALAEFFFALAISTTFIAGMYLEECASTIGLMFSQLLLLEDINVKVAFFSFSIFSFLDTSVHFEDLIP